MLSPDPVVIPSPSASVGRAACTTVVAALAGTAHTRLILGCELQARPDLSDGGGAERRAVSAVPLGLAHLEAGEGLHLDTRVGQDRSDGLLGVGDRRLVDQDDVLEVAGQTTLDDLGQRLLGLASSRAVCSAIRRSSATTSAGTSSRLA